MPSMTPEDRALMLEEIRTTIKEVVNGKIDRLDKKLSDHMKEVEPYLKTGEALKVGTGFVKWVVGALIALGTILLLAKQIFLQP